MFLYSVFFLCERSGSSIHSSNGFPTGLDFSVEIKLFTHFAFLNSRTSCCGACARSGLDRKFTSSGAVAGPPRRRACSPSMPTPPPTPPPIHCISGARASMMYTFQLSIKILNMPNSHFKIIIITVLKMTYILTIFLSFSYWPSLREWLWVWANSLSGPLSSHPLRLRAA